MELGHTLTHPEVFNCRRWFLLPFGLWFLFSQVIYNGTFCLYIASNFFCCPVFFQNRVYIQFLCNLCVRLKICPSESCCFSLIRSYFIPAAVILLGYLALMAQFSLLYYKICPSESCCFSHTRSYFIPAAVILLGYLALMAQFSLMYYKICPSESCCFSHIRRYFIPAAVILLGYLALMAQFSLLYYTAGRASELYNFIFVYFKIFCSLNLLFIKLLFSNRHSICYQCLLLFIYQVSQVVGRVYSFHNFVVYYSFTSDWVSSFKFHQFCSLCRYSQTVFCYYLV